MWGRGQACMSVPGQKQGDSKLILAEPEDRQARLILVTGALCTGPSVPTSHSDILLRPCQQHQSPRIVSAVQTGLPCARRQARSVHASRYSILRSVLYKLSYRFKTISIKCGRFFGRSWQVDGNLYGKSMSLEEPKQSRRKMLDAIYFKIYEATVLAM